MLSEGRTARLCQDSILMTAANTTSRPSSPRHRRRSHVSWRLVVDCSPGLCYHTRRVGRSQAVRCNPFLVALRSYPSWTRRPIVRGNWGTGLLVAGCQEGGLTGVAKGSLGLLPGSEIGPMRGKSKFMRNTVPSAQISLREEGKTTKLVRMVMAKPGANCERGSRKRKRARE